MRLTPQFARQWLALLLFCTLPFFASAQIFKTFRNGVRKFDHGNKPKAERIFKKRLDHKTFGPGAEYYLYLLHSQQNHTLEQWAKADSVLCNTTEKIQNASPKQQKRLKKRGVTTKKVNNVRIGLESTANNYVRDSMNIFFLDSLLDCFPCWMPEMDTIRNTTRTTVVNGNIPSTDYDVITDILNRHPEWIGDWNYETAWDKRDSIWDFFYNKHPLCKLELFRKDHPWHAYARDCWFEEVRDLMCSESLPDALKYHSGNRFTVLEYPVGEAIMNWGTSAEIAALPEDDRIHIEDIRLLRKLRSQIDGCAVYFDTLVLREKIDYYARKYAPRRTAFDLVTDGTNYFLNNRNLFSARRIVNELAPVFPDSVVCKATPSFEFQTGKQLWFDRFKKYLDIVDEDLSNQPMTVWNTNENHEFSAISYSDGAEVFFARTHPKRLQTNVMRSKLIDGKWTPPETVPELSATRRAIPLSITADGRTMILHIGRELYLSFRRDTAMAWMTPTRLIVEKMPFIGRATILPDGRAIVFEGSNTKLNGKRRPVTDLFIMNRNRNGTYNSPQPLDEINSPYFSEGNPIVCADGYTLIYTSDDFGGFGGKDVYSTNRKDKKKWNQWSEKENMGWRVNTMEDDYGYSFIPDNGGDGYYTHTGICNQDRDIWRMDLPARTWPKGSPRFTGIVTDRKGKPHGGGYMEITLDNQKAPLWVLVSAETGAYSFRVPDTTKVIRLYPDVPGHITISDSVHLVSQYKQGAVVRDTFRLASFEEMRTEFQLEYATFDDNQSAFNDLRVYAELTLLHHHATRMGAQLRFIGHTDNSGTEGKNQSLALDRAIALQRYMIERTGFPSADIQVLSLGATQPKCPNETEEGRRCNRRVEVEFVTGRKH